MEKVFSKKIIGRKFFILLVVLFLSGCGVWNNFTAYFNRYYNASKFYDEAEEEIKKNQKELFIFFLPKLSGKAKTNLDKVIEKCSKILQFNKESAFVEKALFITGKSFFYEREFLKAQRKFNELLNKNNPDFNLQAKLWKGKTELQLRNFEGGLATLEKLEEEAIKKEKNEIAVEAYIAEVSYFLYNEDYEKAVKKCEKLFSVSNSDELKAQVTYELGIMYKELGDIKKASEAFAKVNEYSPEFEIEFNSLIETASLQRQLENYETSLEILDDLESESKYIDFLDQIELEKGMNYYDKQDYEKALSKFIIVDTTYKKSESAGIAVFMQAKIIDEVFSNYDSALVLYKRANSYNIFDDYKKEIKAKEKNLVTYIKIKTQLNFDEKQYLYTQDSMAFVRDSIVYEKWRYEDSLKTAQEIERQRDFAGDSIRTRSRGRGRSRRPTSNTVKKNKSKADKNKRKPPKKPVISSDSLKVLIAKSEFELGNLFFAEMNLPDSAKVYYKQFMSNYPDTLYTANQLYSLGAFYSSIEQKKLSDSLFNMVYERFKGEPIANEAGKKIGKEVIILEQNPIADSFRVAEKIYLDSNYADAIIQFYKIANNYPENEFAPKSLYTIGWILENDLDLRDSASIVYDTLVAKYKTTKYAKEVIGKLNYFKNEKKKIEAQKQARADSIRKANMPLQDSTATKTNKIGTDTLASKLDSLKNKTVLPDTLKKESSVKKDTLKNILKREENLEREDLIEKDTLKENPKKKTIEKKIKPELFEDRADTLVQKKTQKPIKK